MLATALRPRQSEHRPVTGARLIERSSKGLPRRRVKLFARVGTSAKTWHARLEPSGRPAALRRRLTIRSRFLPVMGRSVSARLRFIAERKKGVSSGWPTRLAQRCTRPSVAEGYAGPAFGDTIPSSAALAQWTVAVIRASISLLVAAGHLEPISRHAR